MPLQNRVTPWSAIEASPGRGLFTGNRGCLVREAGKLATEGWRTRAWICCVTHWRGKKRPQMQPGVWTNLYFLDEATALAAGHRPCAYCRRADYNRFMAAWTRARPQAAPWRAKAVDEVLHAERTARRPIAVALTGLADGALVERRGRPDVAWLRAGGMLRLWSQMGYGPAEAVSAGEVVRPITVPAMLAVLGAGYQPVLHPTAS
jgi:hypothetical protein